MNITHDPAVRSWIESANDERSDFPLQNLPFGVFRRKGSSGKGTLGIALGDRIIDLAKVHALFPFTEEGKTAAPFFADDSLNNFMACGEKSWSSVRKQIFALFRKDASESNPPVQTLGKSLLPMSEAEMLMPIRVGDYTDFYASRFHATNVGTMLRPDNPLLPNYKHVPIAYHGRSSSIVVSGTPVRRPLGQTKEDDKPAPVFGPSGQLDYELELGILIGTGNDQGVPVPLDSASAHIFGFCLLNDWSARDVQKWEYQPLGPFLAKNFATTISPWIVTREALEPFRVAATDRAQDDPPLLHYLASDRDRARGGLDVALEVFLSTRKMREGGVPPFQLSRSNVRDLYWTPAQMLAHHTSNGCNLRTGDLIGSGTVSGGEKSARGCLLELTWRGSEPVALPSGESRKFLEDGDEVIFHGTARHEGARTIGFGTCTGTILSSQGVR